MTHLPSYPLAAVIRVNPHTEPGCSIQTVFSVRSIITPWGILRIDLRGNRRTWSPTSDFSGSRAALRPGGFLEISFPRETSEASEP